MDSSARSNKNLSLGRLIEDLSIPTVVGNDWHIRQTSKIPEARGRRMTNTDRTLQPDTSFFIKWEGGTDWLTDWLTWYILHHTDYWQLLHSLDWRRSFSNFHSRLSISRVNVVRFHIFIKGKNESSVPLVILLSDIISSSVSPFLPCTCNNNERFIERHEDLT